jgi:putative colanic acid biosysnthesis UDP-glucose lipid carrier transferase
MENIQIHATNLANTTKINKSMNIISTITEKSEALFLNLVNVLTPVKDRKVVIVGSGSFANKLYNYFNSKKAVGYKLMGCFDVQTSNNPYQNRITGNIEDLKAYCIENKIDEIYFARPLSEKTLINDLSNFADKNFIYFRMATLPSVAESKEKEVNTYYFDDVPVMSLRKEPLSSPLNRTLKRAFDIVFSLCVLAILIPFVFPLIALAIKLESRGPVFFTQKRPGKKNQLFNCFKFRSMTVNNEGDKQASKNDKRITKVGAFLRKTSLDELPQFMNVLLGDMSVVGPRPNMQKQLEYYSQHIENYSFRHFVTPGITGYAQVNGYRGETNTIDLMEKRVELDIAYMEKWSLWFDIKIIFLTGWNIIKGEEMAY